MKNINTTFFSLLLGFIFLNTSIAQKDTGLEDLIPVNSAAFMKYDGLTGSSKDNGNNKWIDVLSIDWGNTGRSIRAGYVMDPIAVEIPHLQKKRIALGEVSNLALKVNSSKGTYLINLYDVQLTKGLIGERGASKGLIGERGIVGERGSGKKGLIGERGVVVSAKYSKIKVDFRDLKGRTKTIFKAVQ